jgi:UDP-glucose 4-epimerase
VNYLITGGCGFIGVNLIRRLLERVSDLRIRVIDNLSVGKREGLSSVAEFIEIAESEIVELPVHKLELLVGDIRDADLALTASKGMDAVVHLAANTGVIQSIEDARGDCEANVIGTFNYLEAARKNGLKRFVFASSGAPLGEQLPPIHENMVARPISPYGASKLGGEAYCLAYFGSFGIETVSLRFGNVYGPYSTHKGSVVAKFIKHIFANEPLPIYGNGYQTRDFIFVDDLVKAIQLALDTLDIGGHIFQIATHREFTVLEVADKINELAKKYLGYKCPIVFESEREGEIRRTYSDINKARKILGFEPKYDLKRGLEETFLWFLKREGRPKA